MRLFLTTLALYAPSALACPVCGGGGQNQQAFVDTMIFMSAMPLMMLGGTVFFVWRLAKQAEAEASEDAAVIEPATTRTTAASPQR